MKRIVAVAIAVVWILAACGGSSGGGLKVAERNTKESTTSTTKPPSGSDVAETYFKALAAQNPGEMATVELTSTVPGSDAAKYAAAQIALTKAIASAGRQAQNPPSNYSVDNGTVYVCHAGTTRTSPTTDGAPNCTTYSDFVVDTKTHKLASFKANGTPLGPRLAGAGAPIGVAGGNATLVAAYRAVESDTLFIVINVAAGSQALNTYSFEASYVAPDGRQIQADGANSFGPTSAVQPGANADYVFAFPGVDVGGRLVVPVADPNYNSTDVTIPVGP